MAIYEIKEKMATLGEAIKADAEWLAKNADDPKINMEDIEAKKAHKDELKKRFDLLKEQHDEAERTTKEKVAARISETKEEKTKRAKGEFYRAAMLNDMAGAKKAYEGLGAIPTNTTDLGYGENLLPKTLSNELLTEPIETNSLREIEYVSQITGLEEAKLLFDIEDADLADVTDLETAKEIEMEGDSVTYGRFKTKISATVKDTVLHGSPFDLASRIDNALKSGIAIKEKMRAFSTTSDGVHDHMSFYLNGIKSIPGDNLIKAIISALADLPDVFSSNAKVVMRKSDYYAALNDLINGNESFFGRKPEEVLGYPVIFNDRAIIPVIGDFRYSRQNYDIGTIFETDKDVKKGEYYFVVTAWGDHRIRLKSAFRLAIVRVQVVGGAIGVSGTGTGAAGDKLEVKSITMNDGSTPASGLSYLWQKYTNGEWADLTNSYTGYNTDTLTTISADAGATFRCAISYTDTNGSSTAYTNAITMG